MKKFVSLLLALLMIASLAACGKKANDNNDSNDNADASLSILENVVDWGETEPYRVLVQKGDPKGLLPGINEAIAKMTSENKMEEFIAAADELSGKAVEVTADAPAA